MTSVSTMVLVLLVVAGVVATLMVLVAIGRMGSGIELPQRPRRRSRPSSRQDLR